VVAGLFATWHCLRKEFFASAARLLSLLMMHAQSVVNQNVNFKVSK
jgi:hypothetical protein